MTKLTKVTCYKCSGLGKIQAFSHVAAGTCFACKGTGRLSVDLTVKRAELSQDLRTKAEFILAADSVTFQGLSYERLLAARNFAHNYVMAAGAREVYPGVLDAWREHGEYHFQLAQERKLAEFYNKT